MKKAKFGIGDKVRIINYGSTFLTHESQRCTLPLIESSKDGWNVYDASPELIGKEGLICKVSHGEIITYSIEIFNGEGKLSPYFERQLEMINRNHNR